MRMAVKSMVMPTRVEVVRVSSKRRIPKRIAKIISKVPKTLPQVASRYLNPAMTVRLAISKAIA